MAVCRSLLPFIFCLHPGLLDASNRVLSFCFLNEHKNTPYDCFMGVFLRILVKYRFVCPDLG